MYGLIKMGDEILLMLDHDISKELRRIQQLQNNFNLLPYVDSSHNIS